jgi:hypothetical protein
MVEQTATLRLLYCQHDGLLPLDENDQENRQKIPITLAEILCNLNSIIKVKMR